MVTGLQLLPKSKQNKTPSNKMILLLLIEGTLQMCLQIFNVPCWVLEEYIYIIDNIEILTGCIRNLSVIINLFTIIHSYSHFSKSLEKKIIIQSLL